MRIIFLNAYYGFLAEPIRRYLEKEAERTDVFCLQEVHGEMVDICYETLSNFKEVKAKKYRDVNNNFAQCTYVKNGIAIKKTKVIFENDNLGLGLLVQIETGKRGVNIVNFHGLPLPGDKLDNKERLDQSRGIIDLLKEKEGDSIVGGDFNVDKDTRSIEMFSEEGYTDLIKKYKIATTRNEIAWAPYPNNKKYYSDFVFVDKNINVQKFYIPDVLVSDHQPIVLEFNW